MNKNKTVTRGVALVAACLGSVAWGAQLKVVNVGAGDVMGGVYTSPYGITINPSTTPTLLICDDFETDISLGYSWSATPQTLTQINSANVSTLKFATVPYNAAILAGTTVAQDYATAAVLSAELMTLPGIGTPAEDPLAAGEISYALWSIFDNNLYNSLNSIGHLTGFGSLTQAEVNAVDGYITQAQGLVAGATTGGVTTLDKITVNGQTITGLTIYTPSPLTASQEFLAVSTVRAAEPPSALLFGLDLVGLAGLVFFARRRWSTR